MNSTLEYPINVLEEALNYFEGEPIASVFPNGLSDSQVNGIYYVINRLQSRYRDIIHRHYKHNEPISTIATSMSISKSRGYQLLHMIFRDVLSDGNFRFIKNGVEDTFINGSSAVVIKDIGVSRRVSNALGRVGILTIGDLLYYFKSHSRRDFMSIRCMGVVNYAELRDALLFYDINLDSYQEDNTNAENK